MIMIILNPDHNKIETSYRRFSYREQINNNNKQF